MLLLFGCCLKLFVSSNILLLFQLIIQIKRKNLFKRIRGAGRKEYDKIFVKAINHFLISYKNIQQFLSNKKILDIFNFIEYFLNSTACFSLKSFFSSRRKTMVRTRTSLLSEQACFIFKRFLFFNILIC